VYPHLLYGIKVYANTPSSQLQIILNNKLLRIAQDCSIRTKTNTLCKSYNTLPITVLQSSDFVICTQMLV